MTASEVSQMLARAEQLAVSVEQEGAVTTIDLARIGVFVPLTNRTLFSVSTDPHLEHVLRARIQELHFLAALESRVNEKQDRERPALVTGIREGRTSKGGQNQTATQPRPTSTPRGQG